MMTNHEAKLYLAEKLPERIHTEPKYEDGEEVGIRFSMVNDPTSAKPYRTILETEWQQIALRVEEKIPNNRKGEYMSAISEDGDWELCHADYITRASAMKEIRI